VVLPPGVLPHSRYIYLREPRALIPRADRWAQPYLILDTGERDAKGGVLAPARTRRAAAMTSRTDPTLEQRRKGRGTPLAVVSFPRMLAVAGRGLPQVVWKSNVVKAAPLRAEIAWHPPAALPLDGSALSRELCAGTSSAGRAQATVRLALQRETQGRRPRGTCPHGASRVLKCSSAAAKLWPVATVGCAAITAARVPSDIAAAVRWLISLLPTKSRILAAKLTYALSKLAPISANRSLLQRLGARWHQIEFQYSRQERDATKYIRRERDATGRRRWQEIEREAPTRDGATEEAGRQRARPA
jgi:hypothetical protein